MKTFTRYPSRVYLSLILKIIISTLWLLCIASAAFSSPVNKLAGPTLGQNPASVTVCSGSTVAFTVGSVSAGATTKWQISVNGGTTYTDLVIAAPYSATAVTLTITNISTTLNGNMYRLVATAAGVSTTSLGATVTVHASPSVSSTTHASSMCEGATGAGLAVDFDATLGYQWQLSTDNGTSWSNINPSDGYTGSTTNDLTYPAASLTMNGYLFRYIATITSTGCSTTSIALDTLHILSKPAFPGSGYPTPQVAQICPGDNTSFTAAPTGATTLAYQWQIKFLADNTWTDVTNDAVYGGAQTNTLNLTSFIPAAASNNRYSVRLVASYPSTLGCASVSNPGTLIVRTLPAVTLQPRDTSVCANSTAGFKVTSSGSAVLNFQWQTDNGSRGATWANVTSVASTAATLNLGVVTSAMNGYQFRVIISNACSPSAVSSPKTLTVISGVGCTILPLQLQSFTVQKTGDALADISWKIDPQFAIKYFSVQRSADGNHYMSIGQVNGENGKISYSFTDNTPGSGTIYYRLQITGANDEIVFSPVQTVQVAAANLAQLRPSVTTASSTSIYISLAQQSAVSVYLTNITGQVRLRRTTSLSKGEHQLPLWIGELGTGVYFVHVSDGKGNTSVLTLMKQ